MAEKVLELEIFRYDPEIDEEPYYKTYEVQVDPEEMDILNLLQYIHENVDSSLAYYDHATCQGQGVCKKCIMSINGKPGLACQTDVSDLKGEKIKIEPVKKDRVIRDLVTE